MCISRRYPMKLFPSQGVMNTCPALVGRQGVSTGVALRQLLQQRLGLFEVWGVKGLPEPAVDRRQERPRFGWFALLLPQPAQAHCRPELPRLRLLAPGHRQGILVTDGGFGLVLR